MKKRVLFLCTGNSCRSQMAEGWAKHLKSGEIEPYSAGTDPHGMNARATAVMAEAGVDLASHRSKHVDELRDVPFDYVVTVCDHANETCPVFPGKAKRLHVGFDDPPAWRRALQASKRRWIITGGCAMRFAPLSSGNTSPLCNVFHRQRRQRAGF